MKKVTVKHIADNTIQEINLDMYDRIMVGKYQQGDIVIFYNTAQFADWLIGKVINKNWKCYRPKRTTDYFSVCHTLAGQKPVVKPVVMQHPLLWEPKVGDKYFIFDYYTGRVMEIEFRNSNFDNKLKELGGLWQTHELAEKYGILGVVTPYLREVARYNSNPDGSYWWLDWENDDQEKIYGGVVDYGHHKGYEWAVCWNYRFLCDLFYIKDSDFTPSPTAFEAFTKYLGV